MSFCVSERECAAPRAAEHEPLVYSTMLPQTFNVFHQVPRSVVFKRSVRRTLACATLVEQNNAIRFRIKEASIVVVQTGSRPAVQEYNRLALRITTLLEIKLVNVGHFKMPAVVGLDGIVDSSQCAHVA